jgi:8-oxo-dGTP pyrophosphatase MutT (NUDIX family)
VTSDQRLELVVAGCVVRNHRVLLIWHKKHNEWLPPGGHIEQNESPNDAVLREVMEETGLDVGFMDRSIGPMDYVERQLVTPFFADIHSAGDHDHCCFYYLLELRNENQTVALDLTEVEQFRWFSKAELPAKGVPEVVRQICRLALDATLR